MTQIEIRGLDKVYTTGKMDFHALKGVDLSIEEGEMVAIVGPSGSGKSTILNMITGENIGIVFQFFQLFPTLTALENVMLPMDLARKGSVKERKQKAVRNLELVGLGDKLQNLPSELSGGEQQRVAIARALANDPKILIGDEPTGNLDSKTEERIFQLFQKLNREGKTIIYVTHSKELAAKAKRRITIKDGRIAS